MDCQFLPAATDIQKNWTWPFDEALARLVEVGLSFAPLQMSSFGVADQGWWMTVEAERTRYGAQIGLS